MSKLTSRQADELDFRAHLSSTTIIHDGHHRRTIVALIEKGYMRWTIEGYEAEITEAGRERINPST